jgi:hypothetical protein
LDKIELALGLGFEAPNHHVVVRLMDDSNGQPNATLETFGFSDLSESFGFGMIDSGPTANSVSKPTLQAGARYWLIVEPVAPEDVFVGWGSNPVGDTGTTATLHPDGSWFTEGPTTRGAFRITGIPRP